MVATNGRQLIVCRGFNGARSNWIVGHVIRAHGHRRSLVNARVGLALNVASNAVRVRLQARRSILAKVATRNLNLQVRSKRSVVHNCPWRALIVLCGALRNVINWSVVHNRKLRMYLSLLVVVVTVRTMTVTTRPSLTVLHRARERGLICRTAL